jgi:predicted membrane-bound mannosyltransferase/DNA-binding beta-propeller fold protein YncE
MTPESEPSSILDLPLRRILPANLETLLVILILVAAVVSRFTDLGARAVSHDEVNHLVPSFSLYSGHGYQYDPLSHGPLQFHMIALSFALFGDSDFTARIPAALFSVATIAIALLLFRRYLGRTGAIAAGVMLLISPFMLFYGRYARNEAYIVVWGLLLLYSILRYLERGEKWVLVLFAAVSALHFTDKATSYMYAGEAFIFLLLYLLDRLARRPWERPQLRRTFLIALILGVLSAAGAGVSYLLIKPVSAGQILDPTGKMQLVLLAVISALMFVGAVVAVVRGIGWAGLRSERSLDLVMLSGTLMLPLLSAIPIQLMGFQPLDYSMAGDERGALVGLLLLAVALALGLWWFTKRWLLYAAVFFIPIIVLYTTFLTQPQGLLGALVGSFSYWLTQQGVARGDQPLYYYAFLLIPVYEFLPAIGTVIAALIAGFTRLWQSQPGHPFQRPTLTEDGQQPVPTAVLMVFWSVSSLIVFTIAGEKMPWLTVNMSMPMILATAWGIGWLVETVPWGKVTQWGWKRAPRLAVLACFALLAVLTARTAFRAAFINYDYPFEYLVYAHGTPDPKALFAQVEELSYRITGSDDLVVAYDNNVRYPYWWYMRRFPNKIDYDVNPTNELRQAVVIFVGEENEDKLTSIVANNYVEGDYMRLWWPSWDYWNIKWDTIASERQAALVAKGKHVTPMTVFDYIEYVWPHIEPFFTSPQVRSAVWQIWFNRDFTQWGELQAGTSTAPNSSYTLANWGVSDRMRVFFSKTIASLLWPLGASAQASPQPTDPYAAITLPVNPDQTIGSAGSGSGQFQAPRQIAMAADGTLYVADSLNARIQHLSATGQVLQTWGSFADISKGPAPAGTFNEPWGIAVGPDGSVYVADTWNYRIQKFTADGKFVKMWGAFGQDGTPDAFYGPRGIAVDSQGRVYVADTGNKRIVVFDSNGNSITQFGTAGMDLGQLDEPVAVALDSAGNVYVTDTWNQRVEIFKPDATGLSYTASNVWPVNGWFGNSVENKPFIAVDSLGQVFVTDPEQCRVIEFSPSGEAQHVYGSCTNAAIAMPSGILADPSGGLWVSDATAGKLVHFQIASP